MLLLVCVAIICVVVGVINVVIIVIIVVMSLRTVIVVRVRVISIGVLFPDVIVSSGKLAMCGAKCWV